MFDQIMRFIVTFATVYGFITIAFAIGGMLHFWDFTYTVKAHKNDGKPRLTIKIK